MRAYADKNQKSQRRATVADARNKQQPSAPAFQFVDNRPQAIQMRKLQEIATSYTKRNSPQFINNGPIQRQIEKDGKPILTWEQFVEAFKEKHGDEPAEDLRTSVDAVIREDKIYPFDLAFKRAMDLALQAYAPEVNPVDVDVYLPQLVPQLDPVQHQPDLVSYDQEKNVLTQKPVSENSDAFHYGQGRLDNIKKTQNSGDESAVEPIFFEILKEDRNALITTGDGRHRIAAYHAMGFQWIRASVTASQRATLETRGITVRDKQEKSEGKSEETTERRMQSFEAPEWNWQKDLLPDWIIGRGVSHWDVILINGQEYRVIEDKTKGVELTDNNWYGKFMYAVPRLKGG